MTEIIQLLILNALFITGLWTACKYDPLQKRTCDGIVEAKPIHSMPLWFLPFYTKKLIGEYWTQPFFTCNCCMSSVWGTIFYWTYTRNATAQDFIIWIIYILVLLGINKIIYERVLN